MTNFLPRSARFLIRKTIGFERIEKWLVNFARFLQLDLLKIAYQDMGILKYWDSDVSGEDFVIHSVIKGVLNQEASILFDVGANVGEFSCNLRAAFPQAAIYAFEPNINAFQDLEKNLNEQQVHIFPLGLSSKSFRQKIYTYEHQKNSAHASLYREVLSDLHHATSVIEIDFEATTLDDFCQLHNIEKIDFIKIDTEGHELEVLQGAKQLIEAKKIQIIQFEFNEMNVISRVFLKDFYELLKGYIFYRIDSHRLIPLPYYSAAHEIFRFQNFLAITCDLSVPGRFKL